MFTLDGGKKNPPPTKPPPTNPPPGHYKVISNNPYENMLYPLKLLGIFVFFGALSYLLFTKSDTVHSYIENIVSQTKKDLGFGSTAKAQSSAKAEGDAKKAEGDAKKAEGDAKKAEDDAKKAEDDAKKAEGGVKAEGDAEKAEDDAKKAEGDAEIDKANKKLAVVQNYVETTKTTSTEKKSPEPLQSGFCFVGEERGRRECIKVENSGECISGDIFTTENQCVNPNMRYDES